MLIAVSSFGESLRQVLLTALAEATFKDLTPGPLDLKALRLKFFVVNRQNDCKGCAFTGCRIHPDAALMIFNNRFDDS